MKLKLPAHSVYDAVSSPVGTLTLIASPKGLHAVLWDNDKEGLEQLIQHAQHNPNEKTILATKKQLKEYFAGTRKTFDLPLALEGTHFQKQAWQQLANIPYATTISYGTQAERMGDKKKARAAGMANGRNPISIIIPCHRVIGSNGKLVGFGGGLEKKAYLLQLEQQVINT